MLHVQLFLSLSSPSVSVCVIDSVCWLNLVTASPSSIRQRLEDKASVWRKCWMSGDGCIKIFITKEGPNTHSHSSQTIRPRLLIFFAPNSLFTQTWGTSIFFCLFVSYIILSMMVCYPISHIAHTHTWPVRECSLSSCYSQNAGMWKSISAILFCAHVSTAEVRCVCFRSCAVYWVGIEF